MKKKKKKKKKASWNGFLEIYEEKGSSNLLNYVRLYFILFRRHNQDTVLAIS